MRLKEEFRNEQIINKSRFIACVTRVKNDDEARSYIEQIKKEFSDATHVCTAYICGQNDQYQRSNDNGEPSGTAGVPMLEAIQHSGLQDVCACVVRYFGGVKLGAGGLIRAYSGAVTEALQKAPKTIDVVYQQYSVTYPYEMSGSLEGWLRRYTNPRDFMYDEKVTCLFETDRETILTDITNLTHGSIQPEFIKDVIHEKDVTE